MLRSNEATHTAALRHVARSCPRYCAGLLFALISCVASAALASAEETIPEPGRHYRVVGVGSGDVLNVRETPEATASKTAELRPQETGIVVTGASVSVDGSPWWEVLNPAKATNTGWVNARFVAPMDASGSAEQRFPLSCSGTEPFWGLDVAAGEARFTTPDQQSSSWRAGEWVDARNRIGRFAISLRDGDELGHAALFRKACSDGMSDIRYPFEVLVIAPGGTVFSGCCKRGGETHFASQSR